MGAAVSSIADSRPSRPISRQFSPKPTLVSRRTASASGSRTGSRLSASMIRITSCSGLPAASDADQPVMRSATGFR